MATDVVNYADDSDESGYETAMRRSIIVSLSCLSL